MKGVDMKWQVSLDRVGSVDGSSPQSGKTLIFVLGRARLSMPASVEIIEVVGTLTGNAKTWSTVNGAVSRFGLTLMRTEADSASPGFVLTNAARHHGDGIKSGQAESPATEKQVRTDSDETKTVASATKQALRAMEAINQVVEIAAELNKRLKSSGGSPQTPMRS
jgi:hypothetical protein